MQRRRPLHHTAEVSARAAKDRIFLLFALQVTIL